MLKQAIQLNSVHLSNSHTSFWAAVVMSGQGYTCVAQSCQQGMHCVRHIVYVTMTAVSVQKQGIV